MHSPNIRLPQVNMEKILIVCGPTATGKTALALSLAKKFNGELISADSKQVYKGLDIGTGKDLPPGVKIWGYDLVGPKENFSVAAYIRFAKKIIKVNNKTLRIDRIPLKKLKNILNIKRDTKCRESLKSMTKKTKQKLVIE